MDQDPNPYWIRIQELCGSGSVFKSFVDPDPYLEYGSGSPHVRIGENKDKRIRYCKVRFNLRYKLTIQRVNE